MLILSTNPLCKLGVLVLLWQTFFPATKTQKHEGSLKQQYNGNLSCTLNFCKVKIVDINTKPDNLTFL